MVFFLLCKSQMAVIAVGHKRRRSHVARHSSACNIYENQFLCVLYLFNYSLESCGVVKGEVGKHLTVDLNT